jgi:solute carrier family 45, member 1/2/4
MQRSVPVVVGETETIYLFGASAIIVSLLGLAWAESVADIIALVLGLGYHSQPLLLQIMAIFFVFALNIAIQPVQRGIRARIVDTCPMSQQNMATA